MPIDVTPHLDWATGLAQRLLEALGCRDRDDVLAVAALELVRAGRDFDPGRVPAGGDAARAFRGYAHGAIKWAVRHEIERQMGGAVSVPRRQYRRGARAVVVALVTEGEWQDDREDGATGRGPRLAPPAAPDLEPWALAALRECAECAAEQQGGGVPDLTGSEHERETEARKAAG